jgi:hypothetical protein
MLQGMMFEGRPLALWAITAGYQVIGLVILGLINGAWKKAPAAQVSKPAGNA